MLALNYPFYVFHDKIDVILILEVVVNLGYELAIQLVHYVELVVDRRQLLLFFVPGLLRVQFRNLLDSVHFFGRFVGGLVNLSEAAFADERSLEVSEGWRGPHGGAFQQAKTVHNKIVGIVFINLFKHYTGVHSPW